MGLKATIIKIFKDPISGGYISIVMVKEICWVAFLVSFGVFLAENYYLGTYATETIHTAIVVAIIGVVSYAMSFYKRYFEHQHEKHLNEFEMI